MPSRMKHINSVEQPWNNNPRRDADLRPLQQHTADRSEMYLSKIIHGFKSSVSRIIKRRWKDHIFAWQRSFYDHVVRTDESLEEIRAYINNNPMNWASDKENPANQTI